MRKKKPARKQPQQQHMVMDDVQVKTVKGPHPDCALCGKPIESIIDAVSEAGGGYSHFDCVIKKIAEDYKVREPDTVSYIGQGKFGICSKDSEGKFFIKEKISYESAESFNEMKKFVENSKE